MSFKDLAIIAIAFSVVIGISVAVSMKSILGILFGCLIPIVVIVLTNGDLKSNNNVTEREASK